MRIRDIKDGAAWRAGNLRSAARRRRPSPTEMVTMRRRVALIASALTPTRWHPQRCLCYGCYL